MNRNSPSHPRSASDTSDGRGDRLPEDPGFPLVSVVIATYNRADIIGFAIRSALRSEGVPIEVIVIGDACTDATAEAVAEICDPRVRFVNLPENWGEQSRPSNEGIRLARGRYIAFLNHDDLYLPWHLRDLVALHESSGADVAWSPYVVIAPGALETTPPTWAECCLGGVTPYHRYDTRYFLVASATSYRREVLQALGGWRDASQTVVPPSQDLVFRAYRAGYRMETSACPSLLVLFSGVRAGSYSSPKPDEHAALFDLTDSTDQRLNDLLMAVGVANAARQLRGGEDVSYAYRIARTPYRLLYQLLSPWLIRLGVHPEAPKLLLLHRRRGGFVNHVRKLTGLADVDFRSRQRNP